MKRIEANQALEIDAVRALFRRNGLPLPNPSRERDFDGAGRDGPPGMPDRGDIHGPAVPSARSDKDAALKERLREVWRPIMGYRMAHALIKSEFAPLNVKRVHRVWKLEKLGRMKRYRKKRTGFQVPFSATTANEVWTVDFVYDSCMNGTKLKILSVVDEFTRECLALDLATRLDSRAVRSVLAPIIEGAEPRGSCVPTTAESSYPGCWGCYFPRRRRVAISFSRASLGRTVT